MAHTTKITVRYSETDQMRMVYYAHYFVWMEQARTEALDALGMPYHELEEQGYFLPVLEAHARYIKPSRYGDPIEVHSDFSLSGIKIRVNYKIVRKNELLSEGYTLHVFTNRENKPVRPPRKFLEEFVNN
jgi:acyl-CoA thioester hydrolase